MCRESFKATAQNSVPGSHQSPAGIPAAAEAVEMWPFSPSVPSEVIVSAVLVSKDSWLNLRWAVGIKHETVIRVGGFLMMRFLFSFFFFTDGQRNVFQINHLLHGAGMLEQQRPEEIQPLKAKVFSVMAEH